MIVSRRLLTLQGVCRDGALCTTKANRCYNNISFNLTTWWVHALRPLVAGWKSRPYHQYLSCHQVDHLCHMGAQSTLKYATTSRV